MPLLTTVFTYLLRGNGGMLALIWCLVFFRQHLRDKLFHAHFRFKHLEERRVNVNDSWPLKLFTNVLESLVSTNIQLYPHGSGTRFGSFHAALPFTSQCMPPNSITELTTKPDHTHIATRFFFFFFLHHLRSKSLRSFILSLYQRHLCLLLID